jgi:hypothetical protein
MPQCLGGDILLEDDEKNIIYWLTEYGPLPRLQIIQLLHGKSGSQAKRIIKSLKGLQKIYDISGGYFIGTHPLDTPDPRIVRAIWVLLKFIGQIEGHYLLDEQERSWSRVFFLKGGTAYEIIVINHGEEYFTQMLHPTDGMKYVLVLPDAAMARGLMLPNAPCLFATVGYPAGYDKEPEVKFYHQ